MDLWIRSQDRKCLIKANILEYELDANNKAIIKSTTDIDSWYHTMGKYKNKARALEVLDEIQNILQPRVIYHQPEINYDDMIHSLSESIMIQSKQKVEMELKEAGQVVYQMPKE